jgi:hypothetical protein
MTNELINVVVAGHSDRIYLIRNSCSRRLYYQRLHLKRLITHHRQMQGLPQDIDLESEVCNV